jgi:hypothetical protein
MKEVDFCTKVKNSLIALGAWAYKIPDSPIFKGNAQSFTPAKPCDLVAGINGRLVLIECKVIKRLSQFKLSLFRPSQIETFENIKRNGLAYAFVLHHKSAWKPSERIHDLYIVKNVGVLREATLVNYEPMGRVGGHYDLREFCDMICN